MENYKISRDQTILAIQWNNQHVSKFHVKWLRFHCNCKRCLPTYSGQYLVDKSMFHDDMRIETVEMKGDELICCLSKEVFANHMTNISLGFLKEHCCCDTCIGIAINKREMNFDHQDPLPTINFSDINKEVGLLKLYKNVVDYGFCLVKETPLVKNSIVQIASFMGPITGTNYKDIWEIYEKSQASQPDISYDSDNLPFHQDLPMYESTPGIQILFALRFDDSVKGGESALTDLFLAASILQKEYPEHFKTLCRIPAHFSMKEVNRSPPWLYDQMKPHIEIDNYYKEIVAVNWAPTLEGPLKVREEDMGPYYAAHKKFMEITKRKENEYRFRLRTGDFLAFNNHRMAHLRTAFELSATGVRHLVGCYVNLDDFKCKYLALAHKLGIDVIPPKVGNGCCF